MGKITLINPGNRNRTYQSLGNELAAIEPPVWASLMASFLRRHNHDVEIIDANALNYTPMETAQHAIDGKPNLIAIVVYGHQPSASTQNMPSSGDIALAIKRLSSTPPIMMVGGHVASLVARTLAEEIVDYVATGEGLYAMLDLLNGNKIPDVRGVAYQDDHGNVYTTAEPPLVDDVDVLMPAQAWDLLPMHLYRAHNWHCFGGINRKPYAAIYTTLGCPYKCTFCCIQAPFRNGEKAAGMSANRNSYRFWDPKIVVNQLEGLQVEYGVHNVKFADEMFVLNRRHVEGICGEIIKRKLHFNIWAYARVDTVKDGMVHKLKQAGFNWLAFGIESAVESVRDGVDKGFTQDEMFKTLVAVRDAGINIGANYIFGLPDDNYDTMQQTLDLAIEVNAEYANFYSTMAYPGSPLYEQAVRENWQLPKTWNGYSQHAVDTTPLPSKYLTSQEIVRFRDHAFDTYFNGQRYLDMMKAKFGQVAVDEIKQMCSHKLERN